MYCNFCHISHSFPNTFQYCHVGELKKIKKLYNPFLSFNDEKEIYINHLIGQKCDYCSKDFEEKIEPFLFPLYNDKNKAYILFFRALYHIECAYCCSSSSSSPPSFSKRTSLVDCKCPICTRLSFSFKKTTCRDCSVLFNDVREQKTCLLCTYLGNNKFPQEKRKDRMERKEYNHTTTTTITTKKRKDRMEKKEYNNNTIKRIYIKRKNPLITISVEFDSELLKNKNNLEKKIIETLNISSL